VTVVYDLGLSERELDALCSRLKRLCASGGTVKRGALEIQGDHAQRVLEALAGEGIRARRSGA
jgi:translation initiation factor 1